MIIQSSGTYDAGKIKATLGSIIKVKVHGKYRVGKMLTWGKRKTDNKLMIKVHLSDLEMIYSAPYSQIDWHPIDLIRKADRELWLADG